MSGIAGVYNLDGSPVDPALVMRMTDVSAPRGPDGVGHWIDGPVGLGHRMLHTTPESLQEKQPLVNDSGNLCLTLDGRVDNRDEVRDAVQAKGAKLRTDTDAELVLRAFECWGEECPKRIIGDFAFVIWDGRNHQLFCARDPLGLKPFYYYADGSRFLFGSELCQLFADPTLRREPNEGMVGEYLSSAITDHEETLYRDVFRLAPGHFLLVKPGQIRKERYWDIDPAKVIRYRRDADYASHFFEILTESVRCRLRSQKPVGINVSGGLDSSSILAVAQLICRNGKPAAPGLEIFSVIFPGLDCDESDYIGDVLSMWGCKGNTLRPEEPDGLRCVEQVKRYLDIPDYPNGSLSDPLKTLAREKDVRVLLTGFGGDEWFTGSSYHYADLLRQFKILSLIRQIRFDSKVSGVIFPEFSILKFGLWPLLPEAARNAIKRVMGRDGYPRWVSPRFAQENHLAERLRRKAVRQNHHSSFAQLDLYNTLNSGWLTHFAEMEDRAASWFGLEERHPLYDRRIVEFALALPEDQRWREDQTKYVLRQALRELLPESVRRRRGKADFSHAFVKALQGPMGEQLFSSLNIASMGWVDGFRVIEMYRGMMQLYARGDERYIKHVWPLWMVFGIELWFKTVFVNKQTQSREAIGTKLATAHRYNSAFQEEPCHSQ